MRLFISHLRFFPTSARAALFALAAAFGGCASLSPELVPVSKEWHNEGPLRWKAEIPEGKDEKARKTVLIANATTAKLEVEGLITARRGARYLRPTQPGGFSRTLAPGEVAQVVPDLPTAKSFRLILHDFSAIEQN